MIVVDSSVWIGHLRQIETKAVAILRVLRQKPEQLVVGDLILLELLQGARDEAHASKLLWAFGEYGIVPMLGVAMAAATSRNYRALRRLGITLRRTNDLIIGSYCIENGHSLLHEDRDFTPMATHLGLQVLAP